MTYILPENQQGVNGATNPYRFYVNNWGWFEQLFKSRTFIEEVQKIYTTEFRVIAEKLLSTGLDSYKELISQASIMNKCRWEDEQFCDWFDFDIPLNPSMVAIIGNKGSGKSAFSDIIGHLCRCNTMGSASFLNDKRFRKSPKNYANDYTATLTWLDEEVCTNTLTANSDDSSIEDAQYLPQKYIEDVCNDFGDVFQQEIDKVIFSYVDKAERGDAKNLDGLVKLKSKPLEIRFQDERTKLEDINGKIINLERKKTSGYRKTIADHLENAEEILKRHEKSKPVEVAKPEQKDSNVEYQTKLNKLNQEIQVQKNAIKDTTDKIADINGIADDFNLESKFAGLNKFKFGFNPNIIEYIGELDLIISNWRFKIVEKNFKM